MQEELFTHGNWLIREGAEKDFTDTWKEFIGWSMTKGLLKAYLLNEIANPRHYISYVRWRKRDEMDQWTALPLFREYMEKLSEFRG